MVKSSYHQGIHYHTPQTYPQRYRHHTYHFRGLKPIQLHQARSISAVMWGSVNNWMKYVARFLNLVSLFRRVSIQKFSNCSSLSYVSWCRSHSLGISFCISSLVSAGGKHWRSAFNLNLLLGSITCIRLILSSSQVLRRSRSCLTDSMKKAWQFWVNSVCSSSLKTLVSTVYPNLSHKHFPKIRRHS